MPVERTALAICLGLAICAARAETDADVPDAALLEFLGEWTDANGEFVDPLLFVESDDIPAESAGGEAPHAQMR